MSTLSLPTPFQAATFLLVAITATVHGRNTHQARAGTHGYPANSIQWKPCPADLRAVAALDVECGTLAVPLDYTATNSTNTLDLSLVRVPAVKKPANHSILFNFGGPGLEVRYTLAQLADMLQAITGGEHDLIGWDPRGTAETLTFSCFANVSARSTSLSQLTLGNASDVARGVIWAAGKNYADACAEYPEAQERGPLIDSSFTARDAMQIVDAVEEDGLLRYWGLSYGTALGSDIAALFPERVEKVLLDGVLNPTQWFYEIADSEVSASSDITFSEYFRQCVSTPDVCTLARSHPNATAEQLESAAYALIEEVKYRPIAYNGYVIGYSELKTAIRFALYSPYTWLALDSILDAFLAQPRNETLAGAALAKFLLVGELTASVPVDDAAIGIACVDKAPRSNSFDVVSAALDQGESVSRLLGDITASLVATCAQWKLEPRSRYIGGFKRVMPRKPLLVIGNTYDSATSFQSAKNLSETIKGSVLLEQGGFGHSSIQQPSLCTARAIQSFFRNGSLPKPNTVCAPVDPPFQFAVSGPTWQDLFPQLGFEPPSSNGTATSQAKRRNLTQDVIREIGRRQIGAFW
ncbi:hypothetical protein HD806DRAFT_480591 [Xylariaceae sp. AK1471]|nr:hypothetical protein HD806DRAFT_480591 [Xylariaceae sp. AK1471]